MDSSMSDVRGVSADVSTCTCFTSAAPPLTPALQSAIDFILQVKRTFVDKPQIYYDFVSALTKFENDYPRFIQKSITLFKGHPELLDGVVGLDKHLPMQYQLDVERAEQGQGYQVTLYMPVPNYPKSSTKSKQTKVTGRKPKKFASKRFSHTYYFE